MHLFENANKRRTLSLEINAHATQKKPGVYEREKQTIIVPFDYKTHAHTHKQLFAKKQKKEEKRYKYV